ncbi:MAG: hypothetical protein NUV80_04775 [Candidatus Berkelbacteria bacterium]|nr:hypothetical protein [Candidatus Berkelbacteria bacterium]MCR4307854.1 hypothetical protein [Candidatus Berkelbacteria bacterium]
MSRKLMAMMLAIGLVVGLVGGFAGGYFYKNFKAEDGGQIGQDRPPTLLFAAVKTPVNLTTGSVNYFAALKVVNKKSDPFLCSDHVGFVPYQGEEMPYYRHRNDTAVVIGGEWVARRTNLSLTKGDHWGILGKEEIYTVALSKDGLRYVATLSEMYNKVRPDPDFMYKEEYKGAGTIDNTYYDEKIIGPLTRISRDFFPFENTICEKAGTSGTSGGGQ